jgi:hypothetical protein
MRLRPSKTTFGRPDTTSNAGGTVPAQRCQNHTGGSLAALPTSRTGLHSHAILYEWLTLNPISKVRTSSKRHREEDALSAAEFQARLEQISVPDRAPVLDGGESRPALAREASRAASRSARQTFAIRF